MRFVSSAPISPSARKSQALFLGLALLAFSAATLEGQINPNFDRGFDPEKVYQFGDVDQVNLQSGMLSIHLPIGGRYPVGGGLDYGLTLSYSAAIWDSATVGSNSVPVPNRLDNAGVGWQVRLGLLLKPADPSNGTGTRWVYLAPDHSKHEFWGSLHSTSENDGDTLNRVDYTRDGSYLRLRRQVDGDPNVAEIDFPNGDVHRFQLDPGNADQHRLTQIRNRFESSPGVYSNIVSVAYLTTPDRWEITDPYQRVQKVFFQNATTQTDGDPGNETIQVVDRIELTAFGSSTATYDFQYLAGGSVRRDCDDIGGFEHLPITVPLLQSVVLPDGTSWSMTYHNDYLNAECRRGQIAQLTYPTGGRIEYDYARRYMPTPDGCWEAESWVGKLLAIAEREFVDGVAPTNPSGTWLYNHELFEDIAQVNSPCEPFSTFDQWAAELRVQVTAPDGAVTHHFFSVWPFLTDSDGGFKRSEYGLPFTRNVAPVGTDRRLSSQVRGCLSCNVLRSEYVTYDSDGLYSGDLNAITQTNRRLRNNRTVFDQDSGIYADTARSSFDGVGNYRTTVLTGSFSLPQPNPAPPVTTGNDRTSVTNFNSELLVWPNGSYDLIDVTAAWILGDYNFVTEQEGTTAAHLAKREFQFNGTTGFLECSRTLVGEGGRDDNDLLVKYTKDVHGDVASEGFLGGDLQPIATGSLCNTVTITPEFTLNHTYEFGARATTQYAGASFYSLDQAIDQRSGLVASSFDTATVETQYVYDTSGRVTKIDPQAFFGVQPDAWTRISYGFDGSARQVTVERCKQNSEACTGTDLVTQDKYQFDGLGRLYREKRRRHDGGISRRVTLRDSMGRLRRVSSWFNDGGPGDEESLAATVYSSYDAFGRPNSLTLPDGKTISYQYQGNRWVGTTRSIGTWGTGNPPSPGTEQSVESWHAFDRQGRLWRVDEQGFWNPPAAPAYTRTDYSYDEGSRLVSSCHRPATDASCGSTTTQARSFSYDDRGLLVSEAHPEKGANGTGHGTVSYWDFNSRGQVGRREDGVTGATRRLKYQYDGSQRLRFVRDNANTVLKEFTYDLATGAGLGKLHTAKRSNQSVGLPINATVDVLETYTYLARQGRPSTRETLLTYAGVNGETWTFTRGVNILGGLGSVNYPTCLGGLCASGGAPTTTRDIAYNLQNGFVNDIDEIAPTARDLANLTYHQNFMLASVSHRDGAGEAFAENISIDNTNRMQRPTAISAVKAGNTLWQTGAYAYDGAGNIKSMGTDNYRYDYISRLIRAEMYSVAPDQFQDYTFDRFSNIVKTKLEVAGGGLPTETNFPVLTTASGPTNRLAAPATYDEAGNLTAYNASASAHDLFNMMSTHCTSGTLASCASGAKWVYVYTADDERIVAARTTPTGGQQRVFAIRDFGNRLLSRDDVTWEFAPAHSTEDYLWRGGQLLAARKYFDGSLRHFALDHLGTVRLITNPSGTVLGTHTYLPFGQPAQSTQDGEPMKFTGHERDLHGTGQSVDDLDYMHARYSSVTAARFLSADPVGGNQEVPQTWNRYSYASGNPLLYTDPTGEITAAQIANDAQASIEGTKQAVTSSVSDGSLVGVFVSWQIGSSLDLVSLLLDPLKAGDATGSAFGSGAGTGETALAVGQDLLRTAGLVAPIAGGARSLAGSSTTTLFRAVGPAELADIQATGAFRSIAGLEAKYFTTSAEGAASYARQAVRAFGDPAYTTVRTQASTRLLRDLTPVTVDGGIPTLVVPNGRLPGLLPEVLNSMPIR